MPAKKGTNNFAEYQKTKVSFIRDKIDVHSERLRKSKVTFDTLNALATYLSSLLTEDLLTNWKSENETRRHSNKPLLAKPKPVANSTLSRNSAYRTKLESFLAGTPLKGGTDITIARKSLPMAQAKITELQIESSNFKNKITMLEKYIENSGINTEKQNNSQKSPPLNAKLISDFSQTARALALVLQESEDMLLIKDGQLITLTRMTNQIIVNKSTFSPFLKWFENQGNGFDG